MKNLLTLMLLLVSNLMFSQARIGSTATEIKNEFSEQEYNLTSNYTKDDIYYITIETSGATVAYFFDEDKICVTTMIIPDNQGSLNYYVEQYNKKYVVSSSTEWKMYSDNGIADIRLIFPEEGGPYFLWE